LGEECGVSVVIRSVLLLGLAFVAAWSDCDAPSARQGLPKSAPAQGSFEAQREAMVREQLQPRGIGDRRVLDAMRKVPRERFVPEEARRDAYADRPLPIGRGQTISQPYVVALMAEALQLRGDERILEVGSGSGYAAAVLSLLGSEVYGIEIEKDLYDRSVVTITELGYPNIHLRSGDGFNGWPEKAPFQAIVLSCAAERIPEPLLKQLADGGRLVYPRGSAEGFQELVLVTKARGGSREERLAPVRFVPMRRAP
jgi:protein-L-isoaspartate(D-aspartate) O-methyltransferase